MQLTRLIRKYSPDIVHVWLRQMDIMGGVAALIARRPFVLSECSSSEAYPKRWRNQLRAMVAAGAAGVISNSLGGDKYWNERYPAKLRTVIHNGLPLDEIDLALPASREAFNALPLIMYAGRFTEEKNLPTLVRAVAMLKHRGSPKAILCGDGPLLDSVISLTRECGCDDALLFPGFVDNVWSLMKTASVFVSVSDYEGCPNAVIEAMACGCPLVVSDISAHREFLDESMAILVQGTQSAEIAGAISRVLEYPEEAKVRAERARRMVATWSLEASIESYEAVYTKIVSSR